MEWIVLMLLLGAAVLMPVALAYDFVSWVLSLFTKLENKIKSFFSFEEVL